jgi:RimJ/RimL family protein N-acetyltransferase
MLNTERLLLRDLVPDDFGAVHAYAKDIEVVRFMPWGPSTEAETRDFFDRAAAAAAAEPRIGYDLAVIQRDEGRLLGAIGLHLERADSQQAMIGYCFAQGSWGHGYATEAAEAMLALGFDVLHLHRVWAGCDPQNTASARVLEKLGMTLEGRSREDTRIRGEWRDTLMFGILASEYSAG